VLEEAQFFLTPAGGIAPILEPMLAGGGWAFVSYRPDRLAEPVLRSLGHCVLARMSEVEAIEAVGRFMAVPPAAALAEGPPGRVWLCGSQPVALTGGPRRVTHRRHFYKYLDEPLPRHKRFYFHDERGFLGLEAASLQEFKEALPAVPQASLLYHQGRGDFAAWIRGVLDDDFLAGRLEALGRPEGEGDWLRQAIGQEVAARHAMLYAMR
jgi:hypothetical protein